VSNGAKGASPTGATISSSEYLVVQSIGTVRSSRRGREEKRKKMKKRKKPYNCNENGGKNQKYMKNLRL